MAKRANPFLEDFVQQSKVHVGSKQFNNNEGRLQKVYEKTLNLLFKGAKKSVQMLTMDKADATPALSHSKDKLKQMVISKNGTLEQTSLDITSSINPCKPCACNATSADSTCAYCDTSLCQRCHHTCSMCREGYCSKCTLIGADGCDVCVSCYH